MKSREHEEEQFEGYLKQFRPIAPGPLPMTSRRSRPRVLRVWAWSAVAALLLLTAAAAITARYATKRDLPARQIDVEDAAGLTSFTNSQPLTLGEANARLSHSPSVQEVLDQLALQPHTIPIAKSTQSAFIVLSKEMPSYDRIR